MKQIFSRVEVAHLIKTMPELKEIIDKIKSNHCHVESIELNAGHEPVIHFIYKTDIEDKKILKTWKKGQEK